MDEILERVVRQSGVADLLDLLSERLAPTDLQSLLIEVYRRRATRQAPADLLDQYRRNRFVQPSPMNPRAFLEVDRLAFSLASPPFEPIELSPLGPLGTTSVLTSVSQNVAVATARNTEVVSDSTNVLALECALRRRARSRVRSGASDRVRLCASHRLLRAQRFAGPNQFAHFRAFALWKTATVVQQIYVRFVRGQTHDPRFGSMGAQPPVLARTAAQVIAPLGFRG